MIGDSNEENRNAIEYYGQVAVVGWIPPQSTIRRDGLVSVYNRYFARDVFS